VSVTCWLDNDFYIGFSLVGIGKWE